MSAKTPGAAVVADGAGEEYVGGDEPGGQVVIADVVAFEIKPRPVAVDVDLGLGWSAAGCG
jgi:hypothetical protein